jgi:hypothetical protein
VREATNVVIQNAKFVFNTSDKITSMDNASWANVHGNIVQDQYHIPLLLNVQHVIFKYGLIDSLTLLIMNFLMT